VEFSGLQRFIDTPIKRYSTGMRSRLGFAVAAHLDPDVLIVDEVLAVGDAVFQKKCVSAMHDLRGGGRTVLFVSHNMAAVENRFSQPHAGALLLLAESGLLPGNTRVRRPGARRAARYRGGAYLWLEPAHRQPLWTGVLSPALAPGWHRQRRQDRGEPGRQRLKRIHTAAGWRQHTDMRVFVTGVDGYIGAVLAPYLLERGIRVFGLDTGYYRD